MLARCTDVVQHEYCPPLDPALLSAISSDYQLQEEEDVRQLSATLDELKLAALREDLASSDGFPDDQDLDCGDTDPSSTSDGYAQSLEDLDAAGKLALLKEMFPGLKDFTISHTLSQARDNFGSAVEDLLNQVFFEATDNGPESLLVKGVDGFADNATFGQSKPRGKRKRRALVRQDDAGLHTASAARPSGSKWNVTREDVDFIVSRTGLPASTVSSVYHENGATLPGALRAILKTEHQTQAATAGLDAERQADVDELSRNFPSLSSMQLTTLVQLTPNTAAAYELAQALTKPASRAVAGGIEIITKLSPIDLASSDSVAKVQRGSSRTSASQAASLSAAYGSARRAAFGQASAAYRRGKSDPLMGAAAGYYSSLGRDYDAKAKSYSSAAADAWVDEQSSSQQLDLHGVSVKDAVRIARERVTTWWVGLGEARVGGRAGAGRAYRIVTGVGHHSEGGRGRIGPAVGHMLLREGWKLEFGQGTLIVTGVAKPR